MLEPELTVEPNPVTEGGTIEIHYTGEGNLQYLDYGETPAQWRDVPLDPATGKAWVLLRLNGE